MQKHNSKSQFSTPPILIIGGGRIGANLALGIAGSGYGISGLVQRGAGKRDTLKEFLTEAIPVRASVTPGLIAKSGTILIAVRDDQVSRLVKQLGNYSAALRGKNIAHLSGVHTSDILLPLKDHGAMIASFHPNVAIRRAQPRGGTFQDVYFDMEGDQTALDLLKKIVATLGAHCLLIEKEQKVAVHLAAVIYSNFMVTLGEMARKGLESAGVAAEHRVKPFLPLLKSSLANLAEYDPAEALTGPLLRGDVETIRRHLEFIKESAPALLLSYIILSEFTLQFISPPAVEKMQALLRKYKEE